MMSLYLEGNSLLHRLPAWSKLMGLFCLTTLMFMMPNQYLIVGILVGVVLGYLICKLPFSQLMSVIKISFWLLLMIFAFNAYAQGYLVALFTVLRLFILLLLSTMITLTTRISEMMAVISAMLRPFERFGVNVSKISLCMMLAIRFIPMLYEITREVKEVQSLRGQSNPFALIVPVCIRVFKTADELTQALDARGFESMSNLPKKREE